MCSMLKRQESGRQHQIIEDGTHDKNLLGLVQERGQRQRGQSVNLDQTALAGGCGGSSGSCPEVRRAIALCSPSPGAILSSSKIRRFRAAALLRSPWERHRIVCTLARFIYKSIPMRIAPGTSSHPTRSQNECALVLSPATRISARAMPAARKRVKHSCTRSFPIPFP